ncbi:hypothetical protein BRARA_G01223 [Brassica rapa]|uniref:Uncharacterized protein n=1 Tax=Brassica campestris TaxID=3711 RepID=A0A397YSR4_BRACM|nr:hypothetical protein BRARA_G01223 [Brassica rapa]
MDFDDAVSAVSGDEELRSGQLYFVLPLTWLNHPLRAEEMAALAVKASSALTKSGGVGWVAGDGDNSKNIVGVKTNVGGGRFTRNLSTIAE